MHILPLLLLCQLPVIDNKPVTTTTEIVVEENNPIVFKVELAYKDGWEKTDKIQVLDSTSDISPKLKYITRGEEVFAWAPPGEHKFSGSTLLINWTKQDFDKKSFTVNIKVKGVVPPTPTPTPTPPTPVADNPFPPGKNYVLIVEEQEERGNLPEEQQYIFSDVRITDFLESKGIEYRILDTNTTFSDANSIWKKPLSCRKGKFSIVVANGTSWKAIELPSNVESTLSFLSEFFR